MLCGLPLSNFVFKKLDIWHAHGMWFQFVMLLLLATSFIVEKPKLVPKRNIPLGVFTLWAGIITSFYWYITLVTHSRYATVVFFPFFNFICFLMFYKFSKSYLSKEWIEKILFGISISVFVVLSYCVLQLFNLDQFYTPLGSRPGYNIKDYLVGTIGNPHHLSGYLAICSPLFFNRKGWFNHVGLVLTWIIIGFTGSATGVAVAITVFGFWLCFSKKYIKLGLLLFSCIILAIIFREKLATFFSFNHRIETWGILFEKFRERPITGFGLGILNAWKVRPQTSTWHHAHFEYFQVAIELGIIGLSLVVWAIIDYFRIFIRNRTNLNIRLASIFFGFLLICFTSFPAHLWLLASMGMVGYSFLEDQTDVFTHSPRNQN